MLKAFFCNPFIYRYKLSTGYKIIKTALKIKFKRPKYSKNNCHNQENYSSYS